MLVPKYRFNDITNNIMIIYLQAINILSACYNLSIDQKNIVYGLSDHIKYGFFIFYTFIVSLKGEN